MFQALHKIEFLSVSLSSEAMFAVAVLAIPENQRLLAFIACGGVLVAAILGCVVIEVVAQMRRTSGGRALHASKRTASSPVLDNIINEAIETVCRAASLPMTPETARLRVFIFRKNETHLLCSHYWAANPVREMVGVLRFEITSENATRVAVVQCALDQTICRRKVNPLPDNTEGIRGEVEEDISLVLAAPILREDGSLWGVADFDTASAKGEKLLTTEVSDAVMYRLSRQLGLLFSLSEQ